MQFIAERGIENGLQIVTPKILNPPDCLYTKKSWEILQSYKKKWKLVHNWRINRNFVPKYTFIINY